MILLSIISFFVLFISVKSDDKLVYTECNQTISQREFIIQSETYPNRYSENINCGYHLKGHAMCSTEFHFQFLDFDLENSPNCSKDRLEIIGKENLCSLFTGVRMYNIRKMDYLRLNFVSDSSISGRGFKILVTRLPCEGNNHLNSTLRATPKSTGPKLNLPKCCGDFYNSRRFYLASPGFPHSNQALSDCYYHIYRANPNICRLRIHFKYFSLGYQRGTVCENGFLEIDGKQFCGCQMELDVISQFDQFWGNVPKVIRYKSDNYARNNYNGFVIEVVQDECPVRYSPSLESKPTLRNGVRGEKVPEFYFYNDQLNRISFPNATKENIELADEANVNSKIPRVKIDYYFFKAPEHDDPVPETKYKEPKSYLDTSENNFQLPNGNDGTKCYSWGTTQWNYLTKEVLWTKMPQCKINKAVSVPRPVPIEPKCYDIKQFRGHLNNPGYPFFYFSNLNCCYRFHKIDGYCGIRIYMNDFDLEVSHNCQKDAFILYNQYKYCGNYLLHSHFSMDLKYKQYEEIKFITDTCFCGRGFSLYYEHIPCAHPSPPATTPHVPPMTTHSPPTIPTRPTTPTPPIRPSCGGEITEEFFQINISNIHEECTYYVRRLYEDVCRIKLEFMNFNLLCGIEYLLINNEQHCGNLNGVIMQVDFDDDNTVIIEYRRRTDQSPAISNIFLRGQQLRHTCLDIPAQRIQIESQ